LRTLGAAIGNELRHLLALGLGWTKLLKQGAGLLQLAALRAQSRLAIDQIPKHAVAIFEVQGTAYSTGITTRPPSEIFMESMFKLHLCDEWYFINLWHKFKSATYCRSCISFSQLSEALF
jgi:hypothetical protein